MNRFGILVALALVACGDNVLPDGEPLVAAQNLTIIAHQDDDLIFMQPDIEELVARGVGVTNVYVTAGNGTKGFDYAESRQLGLMAAYASVVDTSPALTVADWTCGWITIAEHPAEHCRLDAANLSLVFLGYPDGGKAGEYAHSLLKLWEGTILEATTVSRKPSSYSRDQLVAAVAEIATTTAPSTVRTLDVAANHGVDHSDHMVVGALALLGVASAGITPAIVSYRGYDVEHEAADRVDAVFDRASVALAHYDACVDGCAACGEACPTISTEHDTWLHRRYAIGFHARAVGQLQDADGCVALGPDATTVVGDCATAPVWSLTAQGRLETSGTCLQALPTGELVTPSCDDGKPASAAQRFYVDDERHIWASEPPVPTTDMDYRHLDCLASSGGRARLVLCGGDDMGGNGSGGVAPTWTFARPVVTTPASGIPANARLGAVTGSHDADLLFVSGGRLFFAQGHGDGSFAAPADLAALDVVPDSLAVGDVDRDGLADACGRSANGVTCVISGDSYGRQHSWTLAFPSDGSETSLALADSDADGIADPCVFDAAGIECAVVDQAAVLRSSYPAGRDAAWIGDLDGDHRADWCTTPADGSQGGIECGVDLESFESTSGASWSFSQSGAIDVPVLAAASTGLADIDGDGLADLCWLDADGVACARSTGRGFGPAAPLSLLTGDVLLLGDLDGDGRADACTLTTATGTLSCALSP